MIKKLIFNLIILSVLVFTVALALIVRPNTLNNFWYTTILILPQILCLLYYIFGWTKFKSIQKLCLTLFIIASVVIVIYVLLFKYNLLNKFSSVNSLKQYILSTGRKGIITYILIQTLQVIFLPIPASIICIVGSLIYGPILGAIYCSIGVLIGSFISFFIGKIFGYKLVSWIVGVDNANKYSEIIRTKGVFFLGLAFLLPMFPDDILCFIAGITKLSFKKFSIITLITRPIGVICMSIFGSGYIIPFSGWGVYAWSIILVVAVAFVFVIMKWQDQIQNFILNKVFRKKRKN